MIILSCFIGKWVSPIVTGDVPPACAGFTLTRISGNTALLYGGFQPQHGGCVSSVYKLRMTKNKIVSLIKLPAHALHVLIVFNISITV